MQIKFALNVHLSVIPQAAAWLLMVPWRGTGDQTRADDAAQVISDISGLLWQWAPVAPGGVVPADHGHGFDQGSLHFSATGQSGQIPNAAKQDKSRPVFLTAILVPGFYVWVFGRTPLGFGTLVEKSLDCTVTHA